MNDNAFYDEFTEDNLIKELQGERLYIEPSPLPDENTELSGMEGTHHSPELDTETADNPIQLKSSELATLLVSLVDVGGAVALGFLAKTKDRTKYRLDEDETRTLENAMKTYLDTTNVKMSPKMLLVSSIAVIYGPRALEAVAERRTASETPHREEKKTSDNHSNHTEDKE